MIKGFNNYKKKGQEKLFWNMTILLILISFISFFIPYIIIDSRAFIKNQLTSQARVLQKRYYNEDDLFLYELQYKVNNGDSLEAKLFLKQDFDIGDIFTIYYSDTDNFHIQEFYKVESYINSIGILIIAWLIVLGLIFLTTFKPDLTLKLYNRNF